MAFTVKQYCEEYELDENRVFNMVLGEKTEILGMKEYNQFTGKLFSLYMLK